MRAYYYQIKHIPDSEIVDEGIIRNSEDTIYPGQNTGIEELPSECECHHFEATNYICLGWEIELTRKDVREHQAGSNSLFY